MSHLEPVQSGLARQDVWSASNATCHVRYQLWVEAEADSICRVLNLFAMQYLIPQQVSVVQQQDMLMIKVEVDGLTWHRAQVIAEKMRSLINVCSVELESIAGLHAVPDAASSMAG
ncbi:hypothetical protein [Pseudomonas huanghezhanensis]|uniref:hypothetical protein n=1 Tax=Pseudomonas huanghezhanensis TaxID=3002903 RepID=UPI002286B638|nr:hypothetical protein [Pseudomonas sp. BSw22131]